MKKVIDFLIAVRRNNNRDWFEANRDMYREALEEFGVFAERLLDGISSFDKSVSGLSLKDITYRIYRDTRFSPNKDPYKSHMGVYICPGGKKSDYAGYYLHVEPGDGEVRSNNLLSSGLYMPEPKVLKSVREEIYDNGEPLAKAIKKADNFELDEENKLKRLPQGYTPGTPWDELLKLRDICLIKHVDTEWLLQKDLVGAAVDEFRKTYDLIRLLNRSVDYAREEA